ncbi:hypothetical protein HRbin17_00920 [bacterium HR17]|uniref:PASTA domain-containing protein n=1 Tax=Candidatus Fervidibacter japonicus TaxID=2035412 RepID=A0A2H5XB39_9BACT|nr:hypothetical protein HRbin17_00920 [bacterium HR17]
MRLLSVCAAAVLTTSLALADHDRNRCVVIVTPSVVRPLVGSAVFWGGFPAVTAPVIGGTFVTTPLLVTPAPFFCVQFATGNLSLLWCEPLQTGVVIIGQPFRFPSRMFIDRTAPFADRATAFGRAGTTLVGPGTAIDQTTPLSDRATAFNRAGTTIVVDPVVTFGTPQVWQNPLLQPGVQVFQLRHRSADEVAQILNRSGILPDGQFVGMGDILIASAPSLATSGVQQSRLRDLIATLDKPTAAPSQSQSPLSAITFRVEVFRAHATACAAQEQLPRDRLTLLQTLGYPCAHRVVETQWRPAVQDTLTVKTDSVEVTLRSRSDTAGIVLTLNGKLGDRRVQQEGKTPIGKQPIALIAPTSDGKDTVIVLLTPQP